MLHCVAVQGERLCTASGVPCTAKQLQHAVATREESGCGVRFLKSLVVFFCDRVFGGVQWITTVTTMDDRENEQDRMRTGCSCLKIVFD